MSQTEVSADELIKLDALADSVEMGRLVKMGVLASADDAPAGAKTLSTLYTLCAYVGEKMDSQGNAVWLRRSRFVAREFAWMQPDRDCLFSLASSSMVARLLPSMFLDLREFEDAVMLSFCHGVYRRQGCFPDCESRDSNCCAVPVG